ncbi:MAG: aquaporin [Bacteroidota bacterium]|jgi:aquaporin Z|nr:aquaporin [Bacteroidota bacterium]
MKKTLGEFISTFFLVFIGTGSVILDHVTGGEVTLAGISIITGLVVSLMIITLGKWSGAHMNPAVTLSLAAGGKFFKKDILPYILAQAAGALSASYLLRMIFSQSPTLGETLPTIDGKWAFTMEFVLTFFLMVVILIGARYKLKYEPWLIGAYVALGIFIGGPYCGGSMNPIRSFAPAVMNSNTSELWIYLTGPIAGAVAGVVMFNLLKPLEK